MGKQVFISYSTKNSDTADIVKDFLCEQGISCWKAPEDIPAGSEWDTGIVEGLHECQVVVLIFSKDADDSMYVKKEMNMAFHFGRPVIPFRVEDAEPWKLLTYLAGIQHLDAFNNLQKSLEILSARLKQLIKTDIVEPVVPVGRSNNSPKPSDAPEAPTIDISDRDKELVLSVLPEYGEWATHQELRSRFNWGIEHLTAVLTALKAEDQIFYRGSYGGCVALRTDELADLNSRLKSGVEPYPYFVNVGDDSENQTSSEQPWRCWEDYKRNNCFGAGGGARFRDAMKAIPVGSEVYLYQSGYGYIGQARTVSSALPMKEFLVDGVPITNQPLKGVNSMSVLDDYEMCEWLVAIDQFKSLEPAHAIAKKGLFVYLATSCRILDVVSLRYLRNAFAAL